MADLFWLPLAWLLSRPRVAQWLMRRALRTPYSDITSADGTDVYMRRWWLFNPYEHHAGLRRFGWFPLSVRIHHILRADQDRHLHDHPWNARSIILVGGYAEEREGGVMYVRTPGSTVRLRFSEFHRIAEIDRTHGAVTLFITGRYRGRWGFKVPYREYLDQRR